MTDNEHPPEPSGSTRPRLVEPAVELRQSFVVALREYHAEGLHQDLRVDDLNEPAGFESWLKDFSMAGARGTSDCTRDRVPHRVLWWATADEYLGRARINLELNDELEQYGGHIGGDVRPSARRHSHATAILAAALSEAAAATS